MPRYINRKNEQVDVTEEHVIAAIKIKQELQKLSPSRRTSWNRHREMMIHAGFEDSDTNESYRLMIKNQQEKLGMFVEPADAAVDPVFESIKHEIGDMRYTKLEIQNEGRALNKLKSELSKEIRLQTSVVNAVKSHNFDAIRSFAPAYNIPETDSGMEMAVILTDIHYGANVNIPENQYNPAIARTLLEEYANKIIELADLNDISKIHVVNLGDCIENAYMRLTQAYSTDLTLAEQVTQVTDLIIGFLESLSEYADVDYQGISGNHDRINPNKNDNIHTDSVVTFINKIIETYTKYSNSSIKYIQAEPYHTTMSLKGHEFVFVHGDLDSMKKLTTLAELSSTYGTTFDAVIGGHIHHFTQTEVGENRYQVTFGSIKGIDDYSLKIGARSGRSQGVILATNNDFDIIKINL